MSSKWQSGLSEERRSAGGSSTAPSHRHLDPVEAVLTGRLGDIPKTPSKTVKIYISSTSLDFNTERQYLYQSVLPELQLNLLSRGLDVELVDLQLGYDVDHAYDRQAFDLHLRELAECHRTSLGPFFLCFLGNKRGPVPLPAHIEENEFIEIRNEAFKSGKDVKLMNEWYIKDENAIPPVYTLLPVTDKFPNFSRRSVSDNVGRTEDVSRWMEVFRNLQDILQSAATSCHRDGKINQGEDYKQQVYFMSGVEQEIQAALELSTQNCVFVTRMFVGIVYQHSTAAAYTDLRADGELDTHAQKRLQKLRDILTLKLTTDNLVQLSTPWQRHGIRPEQYDDHAEYLATLHSALVQRLSVLVDNAAEVGRQMDAGELRRDARRQLFEEAWAHCVQCARLSNGPVPSAAFQEHGRQLLLRGMQEEHQAILLYGPPGCGKSSLFARLCRIVAETLGKDTILVIRHVGLTPRSRSARDILLDVCTQVNYALGRPVTDMAPYEMQRLLSYYYAMMNGIAKGRRQVVVALDGADQLKCSQQPHNDVQINWLGAKLLPGAHVILTFGTAPHNDMLFADFRRMFIHKDTLLPLPAPVDEREIMLLARGLLAENGRRLSDAQEKLVSQAVRKCARPLLLRTILDEARFWTSKTRPSELPRTVEEAVSSRFAQLESQHGVVVVANAARYISAAYSGLSEMELLDLMSCNNDVLQATIPLEGAHGGILRFPYNIWLELKTGLGAFLQEKFIENKTLYYWSHGIVGQIVAQRYLTHMVDIKRSHSDIADLFLDTWVESKPLIIQEKAVHIVDTGWRYVCQQPLLYSDTAYNLRKLSELWYQLLHAGDINNLKEHSFCNYEYLLAKMHATSVLHLLADLQKTIAHALDAEIYLIWRCVTQSISILLLDPLQLASELIGRLRQIKEHYPNYIDTLVHQCMEWCDSYNMPLLVPLSSWLPDPRTPLVTTVDCPGGVVCLCVTRNGQHIFCSTTTGLINMYHVPSKKLIKTLPGHKGQIMCMKITHNNKYVLSGSEDGTITIWEINSGKTVKTFREHSDAVLCMAISKCDDVLVTGSKDTYFKVVAIPSANLISSNKHHQLPVTCLLFNKKNTALVTASRDMTVKVWSYDDMSLLSVIQEGVTSPVISLALSADNTFLVLGLQDHSLLVKAFTTGSNVHKLEGHKGKIEQVVISADCFHCIAACSDGSVYTYNLRTTELLDIFIACRQGVTAVCLSRDEQFIYSAANDSVKMWTFYQRYTCDIRSDEHTADVTCIGMSNNGKTAITGSKDCLVKLWNLDICDFLENLEGHTATVTCVALADNEEFAVSGSEDTTVKVWSVMMGCIITDYTEHSSAIVAVRIASELILSAETGGVMNVWRAENGHGLLCIRGDVQWVHLSPNGLLAASGNGDQNMKLWGLDDGVIAQTVNHADRITCVAYSPDSQYVVTGSADSSLKVWEAANGKLTQVFVEHEGVVSCVAVTDSNRHVISGSHDAKLLVWGLWTGTVEHQLTGHKDHVTCVKVTNDGSVALSGSKDGCVRVWNINYGLPMSVFDMHVSVCRLLLTCDASHLVVQLEHSSRVPLMCLHNSPAAEVKSHVQIDIQVPRGSPLLPIRPKPLVVYHQSTVYPGSKRKSEREMSVSSIPEIIKLSPIKKPPPIKAPLQKAVKAQEYNKDNRCHKLANDSSRELQKRNTDRKKSGVCVVL